MVQSHEMYIRAKSMYLRSWDPDCTIKLLARLYQKETRIPLRTLFVGSPSEARARSRGPILESIRNFAYTNVANGPKAYTLLISYSWVLFCSTRSWKRIRFLLGWNTLGNVVKYINSLQTLDQKCDHINIFLSDWHSHINISFLCPFNKNHSQKISMLS